MNDLIDLMSARALGTEGLERAAARADRVSTGWTDLATEYLIDFARTHWRFKIEEARDWAHSHGLPEPPNLRAWGAPTRRCRNAGWIRDTGERKPGRSSHGSPHILWESTICGAGHV